MIEKEKKVDTAVSPFFLLALFTAAAAAVAFWSLSLVRCRTMLSELYMEASMFR
jgi:hypothetical protein